MWSQLNKVLEGYGSFFALNHPLSKILIFTCAILQPYSGLCGLLGGVSVLVWRKILQFKSETERIEIINGILLGSLIGSLYAISQVSILLTAAGALAVVLVSALFSDTFGKSLKLPLLGLPYAMVGFTILPLGSALHLPAPHPSGPSWLLLPIDAVLPLGAMYFNGTGVGGLLVLLAFLFSSRYLAALALCASVCSSFFLTCIGVDPLSMIALVARMNSVLAACVIGGLFATPGKRSIFVSIGASVAASALTLALNQLFSYLGLPVLALPFVLVTYLCMLVLNSQRGSDWAYFWLSVPALPEVSLEQMQIARERGVDYRGIALKAPFRGSWQVYQGFGGEHTHQGNWHYAIDFFQTEGGRSFAAEGESLSDYYCFGKPVLSPAYGVVVDCRSDLRDNPPGEVDTLNNWGNYVLIKLDCGAYVILSHLQRNSVKVYLGARVCPGETIATVGNSGRSPQPHLHLHVQEGALVGSKTIPFHLTGVIVHQDDSDQYYMRSCPGENETLTVPSINAVLRRSFRLSVGNRFLFKTETDAPGSDLRKLEVILDMNGQFWLESDSGAKVAFSMSEELLAFYNRQGPNDLFLDAFILSFGTTPLVEGSICWKDMVPRRLLPLSAWTRFLHAMLYPLNPCANSRYRRSWDSMLRVWTQVAEHRIGFSSCTSVSHLCESQGLLDFQIDKEGKTLLRARLVSLGSKEDNGIPEWTAYLAQVSEV